MLGKVLGSRYKILEKIGTGGMADVYLAYDQLENVEVALKILHAQFSGDSDFVKRFKREAAAATSLDHENIVKIYSINAEDNLHYIVMEYVKGDTLKGVLKRQGSLDVADAVNIIKKITEALIHAHTNQVIHRDIKPHNILINDGELKIADFGIARTVTQSTITHTGSVLGSIHYLSPEQARGGWTDERADLYSLGIVFYELLVGEVPFTGENPVAVIMKHLEDDYVYPRDLKPEIPQSVENVIRKLLAKDPRQRYSSAKELMHDLETVLDLDRLNEPVYIIEPDELAASELTIKMPAPGNGLLAEENAKARKPINKKLLYGLAAALALVLLITSFVMLLASRDNTPELELPNLQELDIEVALAQLEGLDIEYKIIGQASDTVEMGIVISQEPAANSLVKYGSELKIYVSTGIDYPKMPDLTGKPLNVVSFTLKQLGVSEDQIIVIEEYNEFVDKGIVFNQSPYSGMDYDVERSEFVIYISKGSEYLKMPDLYDLTLSKAQAILMQNDIAVERIVKGKTIEVGIGKVYRQTPYKADDNISINDKVTLYVSDGYPTRTRVINREIYVNANGYNYSDIRIVVYDSRYRNIEYVKESTREDKVYPVELLLMPGDMGTITVYLNNKIYETMTVGYND